MSNRLDIAVVAASHDHRHCSPGDTVPLRDRLLRFAFRGRVSNVLNRSLIERLGYAADGCCEHSLDRPACAKAAIQNRYRHTGFASPIRQGKCFALVRQKLVRPLVSCLFFPSRPTAVPRLIITVVINAFNGVTAGRAIPHILEKVAKRLPPSVTHAYSALPIMFMGAAVGIVAPLDHVDPHSVEGVPALTVRAAHAAGHEFPAVAPAASYLPAANINTIYLFGDSAIALTHPEQFSADTFLGGMKHDEPPKTLARNVFSSRMKCECDHSDILHCDKHQLNTEWVQGVANA